MGISWRPKIGEKGPARKCDVSCAETSFEGLHFVVDDHILNTIIVAAAIRRFRIRHRLGSTITRSTPQQKTSTRRHDPALHAPAQDIRPSHRASAELEKKWQMSLRGAKCRLPMHRNPRQRSAAFCYPTPVFQHSQESRARFVIIVVVDSMIQLGAARHRKERNSGHYLGKEGVCMGTKGSVESLFQEVPAWLELARWSGGLDSHWNFCYLHILFQLADNFCLSHRSLPGTRPVHGERQHFPRWRCLTFDIF